jgi:hypothetical protein
MVGIIKPIIRKCSLNTTSGNGGNRFTADVLRSSFSVLRSSFSVLRSPCCVLSFDVQRAAFSVRRVTFGTRVTQNAAR